MKSSLRIAYYISAHGYGHGVRSSDILRALFKAYPDTAVTVVSMLPEDFLRNRLPDAGGRLTIRRGQFDVGMVQADSIRADVGATLSAVQELYDRRGELLKAEISFLKNMQADLVAADIPALPLQAAAAAGLPSVAIGNFSWDWIYSPFAEQDARWRPLIEWFQTGYRCADQLLKLPFSPAMEVFQRQTELPLLSAPGRPQREKLAELYGLDMRKPWVLLSFTTLDWTAAALEKVSALTEYEFLTVRPLVWSGYANIHAVDREQVVFSDILASSDIVVTKPGYGILSECVANQKPMLYADRTDFIEYPLLEKAVQRYLKNLHIPVERLYAGDLKEYLAALPSAPPPKEMLAGGGSEMAAGILYKMAAGEAVEEG